LQVLTPDSLPTTPDELTAALYAAGSLRQGSVVSVSITKQFETPISHLWFLEVVYGAESSPALPHRLLLKWAIERSPAPERGEPEIVFYRELAPALPSPPMIRCFATASPAGKQQWLLLEDLRASHANPPWPERPSDEAVYDAIAVLARLHVLWWESPALGATVGKLHTETELRTMVHGFRDHLPGFFSDLGDDLPASDRLVLETVFNSSLRPWFRLLDQRALTVIHGDAHTWNFLFPRSGDGTPYIFDWQLWHLDVGARDLAFMIGLHWDGSVRQRLELPLLHLYHEELISAGINNYSFDDLLLDYRRCLVRNLTFPIILWARGTPREAWRDRLDYALAAYRDLNAAEIL
jgi:aminoglycoside phosphotransferase (APT) family kinase protein